MIIVMGNVLCKPEHVQQALAVSKAHVQRSLAEPGCIHHSVLIDPDTPQKLVFVEYWEDMAALRQHFAVEASGEFVKQLTAYAVQAPELKIFEASEISAY